MLISEIAKIVIFEVNLDHPAPETPLNYITWTMKKTIFFVHIILPGSTLYLCWQSIWFPSHAI